ncbi:molybdopterin molybdotransferase MoeA [Thermoplasma sp.]|uniref:molybdopterin molybdotransferase MoeA n=1 Tax=Thermoplasma sp. TaxID=1973142 RepID=UPI00128AB4D1|nr:molybdopterin molybdotransferase MoeA [Thermoplasma sp.]KAA8923020.1 MAG: molybdopterin molybdotransferase MoeA [Thermoplasma sp.]
MEFKSLTPYDEAIRLASGLKVNMRKSLIPVEKSVGHYCAEDIRSPISFPEADRSAVDGMAIRYEDSLSASRSNPVQIRLVGEVRIGDSPDFRINRGECALVYTGSPIPEGANAVIMKEDAAMEGSMVMIYRQVKKFQNISRMGEDLKKGDAIIRKGSRIMPWHLPAFIETGLDKIPVIDAEVGILSTGTEIVSGVVKNSSAPMLEYMISLMGLRHVFYGNVEDERSAIRNRIEGMKSDIVIVTGGSGPSSQDLVHDIIESDGRILFHGVRMKPGRTTGLGLIGDRPVFMISGLPVAALIAFENIIDSSIRSWFGMNRPKRSIKRGFLTRSIFNNENMKMFVRVRMFEENGKTMIEPMRTTGSGVINSVISADGYLIIDENSEGYPEGAEVEVVEIGDWL